MPGIYNKNSGMYGKYVGGGKSKNMSSIALAKLNSERNLNSELSLPYL